MHSSRQIKEGNSLNVLFRQHYDRFLINHGCTNILRSVKISNNTKTLKTLGERLKDSLVCCNPSGYKVHRGIRYRRLKTVV